jgi:hypothetical protein
VRASKSSSDCSLESTDAVLSVSVSIYNWLVSARKSCQSITLTLDYRDLHATASRQLKVGGFYCSKEGLLVGLVGLANCEDTLGGGVGVAENGRIRWMYPFCREVAQGQGYIW